MMPGFTADERRLWSRAAGVALAAHLGVAALALMWSRPALPPIPEPVVLIELPPETDAAPSTATAQPLAAPQPQTTPPPLETPPLDLPPVRAPLPNDAVSLPQIRQTAPAQTAPAPAAAATPSKPATASPSSANATPGADPRAKRAEADYFSLISAHLNRRKTYPTDAKKARQEGVVMVRFTVDRAGNVSNVSIRRSSGHDLLDAATLDLLQRVAPLPKMPAAMPRDSVTVSLPIDYALRTS